MAERYAILTEPQQALVWVGLLSVLIGVTSMLVQAVVKAPVRLGQSLAFRTAFIVIFARIVYRLLAASGPIGYGGVVIYALPGIACAWALADAVRFRKGATE